jgi:hypothetical protein
MLGQLSESETMPAERSTFTYLSGFRVVSPLVILARMETPAIASRALEPKTADDRRIAPRRQIFKGGRVFWHKGPICGCLVRNISQTGACLELSDPVPNAFVLMLGNRTCSCRVVRRRADQIGVEFIT